MLDDECEQLIEEYETLRRRLESVEFAEIERDISGDEDEEALSAEELGVDPSEVRRYDVVRRRLQEECDEGIIDDDEDIDIPDYISDNLWNNEE